MMALWLGTVKKMAESSAFWQGFWRLADPKISLASFAGLFLAACFAAADVGLAWGWLLLSVVGIFCVEVAKNASGEVVDFDSGTDLAITEAERSPFSGGKRVLVDGLLTREQTWRIAATFYLSAICIGHLIVVYRDSRVLLFGIIGMALAWYYHGGAVRLSYRGLGEIAVAVAYGRGHRRLALVAVVVLAAVLMLPNDDCYNAFNHTGKYCFELISLTGDGIDSFVQFLCHLIHGFR